MKNKQKTQKQLLKQLKIFQVLLFCYVFIILGIFLFSFSWYTYDSQPSIDYSNLNEEQKIYAEQLINLIDEQYLSTSREISFVTKHSDMYYYWLNLEEGNEIYGVNRFYNKKIKVYITGNKGFDLYVLQHELCHSFTLNTKEEFICDNIAMKGYGLK